MFTIKYKDLRADALFVALRKLTNCTDLQFKTAYNVMRMSKAIDIELKESQTQWIALCKKYVKEELLPNGNHRIKFTESGEPDWLDGIDVEAAKKAMEDFQNKEVIIKREPIRMEDLAPAKLSPADLYALEFMIKEIKDGQENP